MTLEVYGLHSPPSPSDQVRLHVPKGPQDGSSPIPAPGGDNGKLVPRVALLNAFLTFNCVAASASAESKALARSFSNSSCSRHAAF